jgi:hypothetical protein
VAGRPPEAPSELAGLSPARASPREAHRALLLGPSALSGLRAAVLDGGGSLGVRGRALLRNRRRRGPPAGGRLGWAASRLGGRSLLRLSSRDGSGRSPRRRRPARPPQRCGVPTALWRSRRGVSGRGGGLRPVAPGGRAAGGRAVSARCRVRGGAALARGALLFSAKLRDAGQGAESRQPGTDRSQPQDQDDDQGAPDQAEDPRAPAAQVGENR